MFGTGPSIKNRVRAVILLSTCIVLFATAIAFTIYEIISFKSQLARNMATHAAIVADTTRVALAFDAREAAIEVLAALRAEPDITAAILFESSGEVFASYPTALPPGALPKSIENEGHRFTNRDLILFEPVIHENRRVGTLFMRCSLRALYERLLNYVVILTIVLAASVGFTFLLSTVLQRRITEPIVSLMDTMRAVAQKGTYQVRAQKVTTDEVGVLTDSFNQMLDQLQQREAALLKAREELEQHQQRLERTVDERTAALRDTVQQLETFSYSIAHDMRAPLRTMNNFAGFLCSEESERLSEQGREYLQRIMTGAERLDALINDVLDYSRVSKGEVRLERVSLSEVVSHTIGEYPHLQAKAALIEVREPLHPVIGNSSLLRQCISNLLGNALKFVAKEQRPHVVVRTEPAGKRVRLWIEDNGIGIPADERKNLFGLFHRLSTSTGYPGTGVGLATVKRAMERMNGTVGVESEGGAGSRFWIELPAAN
jgi:signal transduction histidine kinase